MVELRKRTPTLGVFLLATLGLVGCGFEHPLNWEESPAADDLVGSWTATEGTEAGSVARVSREDDGALRFELTYPEETPAMSESGKYKHRATFRADLLRSEAVDVLQIRAQSYKEFDERGVSLCCSGTGYQFRRMTLSPEGGLTVQGLDRGMLGKVAEEAFANSGLKMDVQAVTGCLGDELKLSISGEVWRAITEDLDAKVKAELVAALDNGDDSLDEFERGVEKLDGLEVDPYKELAHIRSCIARHLPSESLGEIFLLHTDLVFSGDIDRYAPETPGAP